MLALPASHRPSRAAPRRLSLVALSALSLFVLCLFAFGQLSGAERQSWEETRLGRHDAPHRGATAAHHQAGGGTAASLDHLQPSRSLRAAPTGDKYLIGVGKADITGPVVELNFAGYASLDQVGTGLRQRIYSRAFIVADAGNPDDRFVYLVLDTQSGDTAVRLGILDGLAALGLDYAAYGQSNVAVTGTHSHSGPGAWFNYLLPQITSLGFDKQSYQAIVDGALLSIKRAHQSLAPVCTMSLS